MKRKVWSRKEEKRGRKETFGKRKIMREEDKDKEKVVNHNSNGKIEDVEDDSRRRKLKNGK